MPFTAVCIVALCGFVALSVDLGLIATARNQCQNAADVGAVAAARTLNGASGGNLGQATANAIAAKRSYLDFFIDKLVVPDEVARTGLTVDDCARVSHHLTRLFTVENIDYERLEVSSPGLDRPLSKLADYARFSGEEAQVHLHELTDGVRRLKGVLRGTEGDNVLVETETGMRTIPFAIIDRGRLVPKIEWRKAK